MGHRLDQLNGYSAAAACTSRTTRAGANTHTSAQDATLNYEPTVNPIASGGYAWVVFTSRRMYGNVAQLDPWSERSAQLPVAATQVTDKKLWVAAIDLNAPPGTDPSHPAFYLPAQELLAGNSRGFWTVDACKTTADLRDRRPVLRRLLPAGRRRGPRVLVDDAGVLGAVRQVHEGQRLLRLRSRASRASTACAPCRSRRRSDLRKRRLRARPTAPSSGNAGHCACGAVRRVRSAIQRG